MPSLIDLRRMASDTHNHHVRAPTAPDARVDKLVTVEAQAETDLITGERSERIFLKMYVEARSSGLLAAISDRDWKTLCTLATYMGAGGFCFPSQDELARALGCSRQMANQRVQSLAEFRFNGQPVLAIVKQHRGAGGRFGKNGYRVLPVGNLGMGKSAGAAASKENVAAKRTVSR